MPNLAKRSAAGVERVLGDAARRPGRGKPLVYRHAGEAWSPGAAEGTRAPVGCRVAAGGQPCITPASDAVAGEHSDLGRKRSFPAIPRPAGGTSSAEPVCRGHLPYAGAAVANNLWQQQIAAITTLSPGNDAAPGPHPLPDLLLSSLPHRHGVSRRMRDAGLAAGVGFLFLALAMLASFINNQRLVRSVGDHLAVYHRLSGTPPTPKLQAQQRLRADSRLLDDWLRRGEPLRYRLGLYQGGRLIPFVEAAINDWAPPPPPRPVIKQVVQGPQTIRLDSMALFDTGKSTLKPGSTKLLVNSLLGIKAKPGWLIVVAGHTDSIGNDKSNQQLSLKRAEAVRDWMRDTGDVPESCFAVQGYGASRPVASNETPEGRAQNRRVEISLVPQKDACLAPGTANTSGAETNGLKSETE